MQLVGLSYAAPQNPLAEFLGQEPEWSGPLGLGYLALGELSGIVGANDSGKSHLLSLLHEVLEESRDPDDFEGALVFASCAPEEFLAMTGHALADLMTYEEPPQALAVGHTPGERASWWQSTFLPGDELDAVTLSAEDDHIAAWQRALLAHVTGDREAWRSVLEATAEGTQTGVDAATRERDGTLRRLIALEPVGDEGGRVWNLFWCLPPIVGLPGQVQNALRDCGLRRAAAKPDLWGDQWATGQLHMLPTDDYRRLVEAPIVVAPLGRTRLPIAPGALKLPQSIGDVRGEVEARIGRVLASVREVDSLLEDGLEGRLQETDTGVEHTAFPLSPDEAWAERDADGAWRVPADAPSACRLIEGAAQSLMPRAISRRYALEIEIRHPQAWPDGKIDLRLRRRTSAPRIWFPLSFPLERAADGDRLWLQLAILEATAALERATVPIRYWTHRLMDALEAVEEDEQEYRAYFETTRLESEEALNKFRGIDELKLDAHREDRDLRLISEGRDSEGLTEIIELIRGRIYVIDEPERHLHPRRQREMARWLADTVRRQGSQAVIATHSVPFMGVTEGARYSYLAREGWAPSLLVPIAPRELDRVAGAAHDLGLNRGELMALIDVFLWVEGPMDQVVFENLFPEELRNYGIEVAPMSGHARATAILDTALLRLTDAKIAVWLDNIPGDFLAGLRNEPDFAHRAAIEEKDNERKTLAKLVLTAREQEKEIHPLGGVEPGKDVFDLLDEETIRELYPGYPGHARAQAAWAEALEQGWKQGNRKRFWDENLGTPISRESCERIAHRMRERDRPKPPELAAVIEACERLAAELS